MRRRAFTVVPVVAVLALVAIVLAILLGVKGVPQPATASAAYNAGRAAGSWLGPIFVAVLFFLLASPLAERRGNGFATAVAGSILLLVNIAVGVNVLRAYGVVGSRGPGAGPSALPAAPLAARPPVAQPTPRPVPQPAPADPPSSVGPQAGQPAQQPAAAPDAALRDRLARERAEREAAEKEKAEKAAALAKVLDGVEADEKAALDGASKAVADAGRAFAATVARAPQPTRKALDERRAGAEGVRQSTEALRGRIKGAQEGLEKKLRDAGAEEFDAHFRASRAGGSWDLHQREFAADSLTDFCGLVTNECEVLGGALGTWKLKAGEIDAKDAMVKARLSSPRFRIEASLAPLERSLQTLAGN